VRLVFQHPDSGELRPAGLADEGDFVAGRGGEARGEVLELARGVLVDEKDAHLGAS
jgi:hypothetical protein